jgi:hypothetical protein
MHVDHSLRNIGVYFKKEELQKRLNDPIQNDRMDLFWYFLLMSTTIFIHKWSIIVKTYFSFCSFTHGSVIAKQNAKREKKKRYYEWLVGLWYITPLYISDILCIFNNTRNVKAYL